MASALEQIAAKPMVTYAGAFGAPTVKRLTVWTTYSLDITSFHLKRSIDQARACLREREALTGKPVPKLAICMQPKKQHVSKWRLSVSGTRAITESKQYPPLFCAAVVDLAVSHLPA